MFDHNPDHYIGAALLATAIVLLDAPIASPVELLAASIAAILISTWAIAWAFLFVEALRRFL